MNERQNPNRKRRRRSRSKGREGRPDGGPVGESVGPSPVTGQNSARTNSGNRPESRKQPNNNHPKHQRPHQPKQVASGLQPVLDKKPKADFPPDPPKLPGKCAVVFYETFMQAKADQESLRARASTCDQLNIVIRQEGDMEDAELSQFGKVFAGAAWTLIHERRQQEGWYEQQAGIRSP